MEHRPEYGETGMKLQLPDSAGQHPGGCGRLPAERIHRKRPWQLADQRLVRPSARDHHARRPGSAPCRRAACTPPPPHAAPPRWRAHRAGERRRTAPRCRHGCSTSSGAAAGRGSRRRRRGRSRAARRHRTAPSADGPGRSGSSHPRQAPAMPATIADRQPSADPPARAAGPRTPRGSRHERHPSVRGGSP